MNIIIVTPGNTKPSLRKPVIETELKYVSKFISIKIINSINGIDFESKSLFMNLDPTRNLHGIHSQLL